MHLPLISYSLSAVQGHLSWLQVAESNWPPPSLGLAYTLHALSLPSQFDTGQEATEHRADQHSSILIVSAFILVSSSQASTYQQGFTQSQ